MGSDERHVGAAELSISEAARRYRVSRRRLTHLLSTGELPGHKVKGSRGPEWRVSSVDVEALGCARPPTVDVTDAALTRRLAAPDCCDAEQLHRALARARAANADMDGRLGHALLTIGALRGQLRRSGLEPEAGFARDADQLLGRAALPY